MQTSFGAGPAWVTPISDGFGSAIATPTPIRLGIFQDFSLDHSRDVKELYGTRAYADDFGGGKVKLSGKAKNAQILAQAWNSIVFGQTLATGQTLIQADNTGATIPGTPYTITPTVPNSGTWLGDLGVRNASGLPMTKVASAPATGQYSVSAGVYTFAAADTGLLVYIDFSYTVTGGKTLAISNVYMGDLPIFQLEMRLVKGGKSNYIKLPFCAISKFGLSPKQDDFLMPEFDFVAGGGLLNGAPLTLSTSE